MSSRAVVSDSELTLDELEAIVQHARTAGYPGNSRIYQYPVMLVLDQVAIVESELVFPAADE